MFRVPSVRLLLLPLVALIGLAVGYQASGQKTKGPPKKAPPHDAIEDAQTPRPVAPTRAEQQKSKHDKSDIFKAENAPVSTPELDNQPEGGRFNGFEFYRDPLGSKKPGMTLEEIMADDKAQKPKVMALQ